jgi:hypothetical protein
MAIIAARVAAICSVSLPHHRGSLAVVPIDRGLRNDCAPLDVQGDDYAS